MIYYNGSWHSYKPIIITKMTIPTTALLDAHGRLLMDNNNEILTTADTNSVESYYDMVKYIPMIK